MIRISISSVQSRCSRLLSFRTNPSSTFHLLISSMTDSSNIIVEYAKSNRSSCKKCAQKIPSNAPRLGLVSRDPRGHDMTRWHHFHCFPLDTASIPTAEAIKGFSSLKTGDQENLIKMVKGGDQSREKADKEDEDTRIDGDERSSKKPKLSVPIGGAELAINFSVSDIKDQYQDAKLLPKWKAFQTIIFLERDEGLNDSCKIAAFDFDGCLAKTSVKRIGATAWSLMYPSIPEKLSNLYNDGYKLVIFTNESNIDRWKNKRQVAVDSKLGRLTNFITKVQLPIQVFVACGYGTDPFRKPNPGMWHVMAKHFNSGVSIDMGQSFYVGDAAGRPDDHSDADIKFAEAVGLKFYVPEEYFIVN